MIDKRTFYISSFVFLGILLSIIIHAAIEIPVINLLTADFDRYSLGLSWRQWYAVHHVGTAALTTAGIALGYWQGRYWWMVSVEKRFGKR